ncbi:hypothetical protein BDL97_17G023500 [Sphagnum fallax]|nr:hypothetical protein BDL97_17G023500 [Sphagnum fallax]KAH8935339.1 hypothetical protein BDL97_17G023500 [Sphagnum fallax]KAH8935342.1 hypothetical protein BDL97_17G023500 [Sphagnum fallax]KAH8935347.1 hypothetical protein BDL97_17G023500 [Sphagnum fallax]KAH8935352.1 hypothetical protein BDL97_17G023500 [Sphagnum fallax]
MIRSYRTSMEGLKRAAARIGAGDEDGSKILVRVGLAVTCSVAAFTVSYLTTRGWNINKPEDGSDPPPSEEEAVKGDYKLIEINHELQHNHESQSLVASDPSPPKLMQQEEKEQQQQQQKLNIAAPLALIGTCLYSGYGSDQGSSQQLSERGDDSRLEEQNSFTPNTELSGDDSRLEEHNSFTPDHEVNGDDSRCEEHNSFTPNSELSGDDSRLEEQNSFTPNTELSGDDSRLEEHNSFTPDHEVNGDDSRCEEHNSFTPNSEPSGDDSRLEEHNSFTPNSELSGDDSRLEEHNSFTPDHEVNGDDSRCEEHSSFTPHSEGKLDVQGAADLGAAASDSRDGCSQENIKEVLLLAEDLNLQYSCKSQLPDIQNSSSSSSNSKSQLQANGDGEGKAANLSNNFQALEEQLGENNNSGNVLAMGGGHVAAAAEELEALRSTVERLQAKETQLERQLVECEAERQLQADQALQVSYKIKQLDWKEKEITRMQEEAADELLQLEHCSRQLGLEESLEKKFAAQLEQELHAKDVQIMELGSCLEALETNQLSVLHVNENLKKELDEAWARIQELQKQVQTNVDAKAHELLVMKQKLDLMLLKAVESEEPEQELEQGCMWDSPGVETEQKVQHLLHELEIEVMKLRGTVKELEQQKTELSVKLCAMETENLSMINQAIGLQNSRNFMSEVEELVYLRWVNACLRHKLNNYNQKITTATATTTTDDAKVPPSSSALDLNKSSNGPSESLQPAKEQMLEYVGSTTSSELTALESSSTSEETPSSQNFSQGTILLDDHDIGAHMMISSSSTSPLSSRSHLHRKQSFIHRLKSWTARWHLEAHGSNVVSSPSPSPMSSSSSSVMSPSVSQSERWFPFHSDAKQQQHQRQRRSSTGGSNAHEVSSSAAEMGRMIQRNASDGSSFLTTSESLVGGKKFGNSKLSTKNSYTPRRATSDSFVVVDDHGAASQGAESHGVSPKFAISSAQKKPNLVLSLNTTTPTITEDDPKLNSMATSCFQLITAKTPTSSQTGGGKLLIKDRHNINDTTATVMAQTENLEIKDT